MWRVRGAVAVLYRLSSNTQSLPQLTKCSSAVQRVFDDEMASQAAKSRVQVAELVHQFQCQPGDTGSTPVQIAVLTFRIKHLTEHVQKNRKDFSCQRSLVKMVHQRRKLLRYLERTDHLAYQSVLAKLHIRTPKPQTYSRA
jgi:small subunit ribosomal protein S15